jgi:hypothetical protein
MATATASDKLEFGLNNLKQQIEQEYAASDDVAFEAIAHRMFAQLAYLASAALRSEPLDAAQSLKDASNLITAFMNQYQESYSKKLEEDLTVLKNLLDGYQAFFEAIGLLKTAEIISNQTLKYQQEIKSYKILAMIATRFWFTFDLENRDLLEKLASRLPRKKGFDVEADSWKEFKLRFKFLVPSIQSGGSDLFAEYKEALADFTSSVASAVERDTELKLWQLEKQPKQEAKYTIGNLLNWMKTAPPWAGDDFEECLEYVNQVRK